MLIFNILDLFHNFRIQKYGVEKNKIVPGLQIFIPFFLFGLLCFLK